MKKVNLPKATIATLTTLMIFLNTGIAFADTKKDETVYTILKEDGNVDKTIVSTWINSDKKLGEFKDYSNLKNITNVKGDEKPKIDGDKITWNVNNEDLYYKGDSKEKLPIDVDIKYELNNKKVSAKDIKGKSGKFKITIKLNNNEKRNRKINNTTKEMYVPFLTATEVLFQRDNFKNIKINSGELIDDGKNSSITFTSFPGLKETLELDKDLQKYIDLEDTLVIEGQANKFEMPNIMIVSTPKLPELKGIDENSTLNDLSKSLNDLKKGGDDLLDGSKKLLDGNNELNSNFAKFDEGVKSLAKGSTSLSEGINKLNQSAPTLNLGAKSLSSGLSQLNSSQSKFNEGVSSLSSNTDKLYEAYSNINNGISNAKSGADNLSSGLNNGVGGIDGLIGSTNNIDQLAGGLVNLASMIEESNPDVAGQLRNISGSLNQVSQGQRDGLSSLKNGVLTAANGASSLSDGLSNLKAGSDSFNSNLKALSDGCKTLSESSKQLSSATNQLEEGSKKLVSGTDELSKGTNQLAQGGKSLVDGTNSLTTNSSKLLKGTNALAKGSSDLYNGVSKLKTQGLDKLYKEGNTKLSNINGLMDIKDEIVKLSKEYNNFAGKNKDMNGSVKFIMKINN
ncbi:hypothetical protein [Paraclostridium sordellii]|uniref:hypothetical protein n=1 Tax=Paraclostridium sordellii TaxID=1505 RepID=UPI0005E8BCFB|nr:hypothetical protein [Paeniclostridium sordellii]CEO22742.1 membrane protein-like protein [[Clostridium] sordellii] [Paeniclostridium sordellii]CEQ14441.1 membrane protein-like protein [[Clostridium] sordellii] [Paeniclostridium sordellii]